MERRGRDPSPLSLRPLPPPASWHGLRVAPPGLLAGSFAQRASLLALQGSLGTGAGQAEEPAERHQPVNLGGDRAGLESRGGGALSRLGAICISGKGSRAPLQILLRLVWCQMPWGGGGVTVTCASSAPVRQHKQPGLPFSDPVSGEPEGAPGAEAGRGRERSRAAPHLPHVSGLSGQRRPCCRGAILALEPAGESLQPPLGQKGRCPLQEGGLERKPRFPPWGGGLLLSRSLPCFCWEAEPCARLPRAHSPASGRPPRPPHDVTLALL